MRHAKHKSFNAYWFIIPSFVTFHKNILDPVVHSKEWFYLDDDDDDDNTNNNFACEQFEMQKIPFYTVIKATITLICPAMQALQNLLVVLSSGSCTNFRTY